MAQPAIIGAGLQELVDLFTILYALRALAERPDARLATAEDRTREPAGRRAG